MIRGDIHILLVGDPGCLRADERIGERVGSLLREKGKKVLVIENDDVRAMGDEKLKQIGFILSAAII